MINLAPPKPLDRFFAHMGWDSFVRYHNDFPLTDFQTVLVPELETATTKIYIRWSDRRTGELGAYGEDIAKFPSPVLIASFQLLVGPIDNIRADYNRVLNRRNRRRY